MTTLVPGELCKCGTVAVRTLGTIAYCGDCVEAILRPLMASRGVAIAPYPEYGPGWYELKCRTCEAGWVGIDGDACSWCAIREAATVVDQGAVVTQPPDNRTPEALTAWRGRLKRAVEAGVITEMQARYAFERAQQKDAA
jgi:hypothetical protein